MKRWMRLALILFVLSEGLALYGASVIRNVMDYPSEVPAQVQYPLTFQERRRRAAQTAYFYMRWACCDKSDRLQSRRKLR